MDPLMPPPPIRRIAPGRAPVPVQAPEQNGTPAAGVVVRSRPARRETAGAERMRTEGLTIAYDGKVAVNNVNLAVREGEVLALIGPSGCGKTTLLRSLNRLVELSPGARRSGRIVLDTDDIDHLDVTRLRRRVAMVFQQPNPFPMSIFDNVAYAIREQGSRRARRSTLEPMVRSALERAGLWDEVHTDLDRPALRLSGGQQQRLCIARALAVDPEVLLLDEPCSALDPRSTATIEELILDLREHLAVVIVTHNLQQAYRIADTTAFMYLGELVEHAPTETLFHHPEHPRTADYVAGAFG
jgi:phosphate transport system ATP-binding protein